MCNVRRTSLFVILTLLGLVLALGAVNAGTISGKIYDADGKTQLTTETIHIDILDANGGGTIYSGDFPAGTYAFSIDPTKLAPADKTVQFNVTRKGQVTRTIIGLAGNVTPVQTVHITAPAQ